ncbi:MFS transporter [Alphaproteobacteria bacterium]|nr:MFS transporter [Alphaproteobacteria bacterium]
MKLFDGVSATIWRMGLSQALMMTVMNVNLTNTALVGSLLAPSPWLITLPLSIQFIAVMIATIPASLLMAKFGRRPVFLAGVIVVSIGAFGQALSILTGSFIPLVFSSFLVGLGQGVAQFYRYAAADTAEGADKAKAVSFVLLGGLVSAIIGPEIAFRTVYLVPNSLYAGCFIVTGLVQMLAIPVIWGLKLPPIQRLKTQGRHISKFLVMPSFLSGLIAAALGYGLMTFLMTATPLQIVDVSKLSHEANARVIQWHVFAMFAPSLFSGILIAKFGVGKILWVGLACYVLASITALSGNEFYTYLIALILLGIGWNFLYVGGSSIIANCTNPEERGRVQGIADFCIFSMVATASMLSGMIHNQLGWVFMMTIAFVPIFLIAVSLILGRPKLISETT